MPEFLVGATAASVLGAAGKVAGIEPIKAWLHGCKTRAIAGRVTPRNHDLVKGVRTAHLCALDHVARRYTKLLTTLPNGEIRSDDHAFANSLRVFIDERLKVLSDKNIDHEVLTADDLNHVLEQLVHAAAHESYAELSRKAQADCEDRALKEIAHDAGWEPPTLFVQVFKGDPENAGAGWYEAFSFFVTEQLKTNERFRSIFFATELADIRKILNELSSQKLIDFPDLSGFMTTVQQQLDRIEDKLDKIQTTADITQETFALIIKAVDQNDSLSKELQDANLDREKVMALARSTALNINDFDQALKELEYRVKVAIEVEQEGRAGSNLGDFVDAVLARVREKYDANDFDAAAAEADEGFAEWERREAERKTESLQVGLKILRSGLHQDILSRNATSAAKRITRICELKHPDTQPDQQTALGEAFTEWLERGRDAGLNFDLEIAIEIAALGQALALGKYQRGYWQNNLGNALATLGKREGGTERLEQAVTAIQSALEEWTQESMPLQWAGLQNNLGNALSILGEREGLAKRLEQAVIAYEAALKERRQESVPLQWAMTQNNLGNALQTLGQRERGTKRLEQAVDAYQSALEERRQESVPLQWATTQNNLGNALSILGQQERGTKRLEQAVIAYQSALEEFRQDRVPLDWAMTQNNLGTTLAVLGQRESGTERLEQAVIAFQSALEEFRQDRVPLDWAMTQNNLGNALQALGQGESEIERLYQAIDAFQLALEERRQDNVPLEWATTLTNQANTFRFIAERSYDLTLAKQALSQSEEALETFQQAGHIPSAECSKGVVQSTRALVEKLGG
ncbi:tetratricopeptide repeat protein [Thalassospira lucentensis]|uniref:tetratricopeptide repeat protein n=1 Tax=Thalassospira lucentensis TaxID=168935 RepID=UPI003AA7DB89